MGSLSGQLSSAGLPTDLGSNINAPTLSDLGGSLGDKATGLAAGPTNAYNSYATTMSGAGSVQNPLSVYKGLLDENGIPQLQQTAEGLTSQVNNLNQAINRVTPNVDANTGNSLVTESQREGMVNNQTQRLSLAEAPIATDLSNVENALTTQEQNINGEVGAVTSNNDLISQAGQLGVSTAQANATMEATGYTQDAANMLQGLMTKMQITGTLDADEWNTLSTLATRQQAYNQQINTIAAQQKYQTVAPGSTLVNTQTGKTFVASGKPAPTYVTG